MITSDITKPEKLSAKTSAILSAEIFQHRNEELPKELEEQIKSYRGRSGIWINRGWWTYYNKDELILQVHKAVSVFADEYKNHTALHDGNLHMLGKCLNQRNFENEDDFMWELHLFLDELEPENMEKVLFILSEYIGERNKEILLINYEALPARQIALTFQKSFKVVGDEVTFSWVKNNSVAMAEFKRMLQRLLDRHLDVGKRYKWKEFLDSQQLKNYMADRDWIVYHDQEEDRIHMCYGTTLFVVASAFFTLINEKVGETMKVEIRPSGENHYLKIENGKWYYSVSRKQFALEPLKHCVRILKLVRDCAKEKLSNEDYNEFRKHMRTIFIEAFKAYTIA